MIQSQWITTITYTLIVLTVIEILPPSLFYQLIIPQYLSVDQWCISQVLLGGENEERCMAQNKKTLFLKEDVLRSKGII